MKIIDIITIFILILIMVLFVKFAVEQDKKYQKDLVDIASKIDKVSIYNNCYEVSNMYVCIED